MPSTPDLRSADCSNFSRTGGILFCRSHLIFLICFGACLLARSVLAGENSEDSSGFQLDGSLGHIAFPTLGRDTGITPLELFPYVMSDSQILFGDFRTFLTNDGRVGGNLGVGYRFIEPSDTALFGVSGWYDFDQSTGKTFNQLGLSLEARMKWMGLSSNLYLPVGDTNQILQRNLSNVRFDEHQILFDVSDKNGESMRGLDVMFNAYVPFDYLIDHEVQAHAGWYHFQGETQDDINGFKLQLEGNIVPAVSAQATFTQDATFGTNATLGLFWRFGKQELPDVDLQGQLRRFANRNYNIIVSKWGEVNSNVAAVNSATNQAYVVQHIGSGIGTDSGTAGDPWRSVSQAQFAGGEVLFVHSNTTLTESIVLKDGQYLLGEGVKQSLVDKTYGKITLPSTTNGSQLAKNSNSQPKILNSLGTAITMADNTVVSGITIENAGGDGIVAAGKDNIRLVDVRINGAAGHGLVLDGVTNAEVDGDIEINGVTGDGIHLANINDELKFGDITVSDVGGVGVNIDGGYGEITFDGTTEIRNAAGGGFRVANLETLIVGEDDTTTTDSDDEEDSIGLVRVKDLTIVGGSDAQGIVIQDTDGIVYFDEVDVQTTNQAALYFRNADEVWIADGTLNSTNAAAADLEGSTFNIALTSIFVDGGPQGLRIVDSEGQFFVYGDGATDDEDATEGTGGLIQNTDVAIYLDGAGTTGMRYVNFSSNQKVATAKDSDSLEIQLAKVTQTSIAFVEATNLTNLSITGSHFEENSTTSGHGIRFDVGTSGSFSSTFSDNIVLDTNGTLMSITTLTGGETAKLSEAFKSNDITLSSTGDIASRLNWSGTVQAEFSSNQVVGDASSQTAFDFNFGDSTSTTNIAVNSNQIIFNDSNSVAARVVSEAPMTFSAEQNQIAFKGRDGVGFDLTFGKVSSVTVSNNSIYDYAGGATAIHFPSVYDGTRIALEGNLIDLSRSSQFIDQGIVLSAVAGSDDPFVTLYSSTSNTIKGASTTFYCPASGVTGQVIINDEVIK